MLYFFIFHLYTDCVEQSVIHGTFLQEDNFQYVTDMHIFM